MHGLFGLIEKEFEGLYMENVSLTEKLELMTERMERESICTVTDRYRQGFTTICRLSVLTNSAFVYESQCEVSTAMHIT